MKGRRYLGAFVGLREDMEVWFTPHVEAWAEGVLIPGQSCHTSSLDRLRWYGDVSAT